MSNVTPGSTPGWVVLVVFNFVGIGALLILQLWQLRLHRDFLSRREDTIKHVLSILHLLSGRIQFMMAKDIAEELAKEKRSSEDSLLAAKARAWWDQLEREVEGYDGSR